MNWGFILSSGIGVFKRVYFGHPVGGLQKTKSPPGGVPGGENIKNENKTILLYTIQGI